jgi:hypothetical protein
VKFGGGGTHALVVDDSKKMAQKARMHYTALRLVTFTHRHRIGRGNALKGEFALFSIEIFPLP